MLGLYGEICKILLKNNIFWEFKAVKHKAFCSSEVFGC